MMSPGNTDILQPVQFNLAYKDICPAKAHLVWEVFKVGWLFSQASSMVDASLGCNVHMCIYFFKCQQHYTVL